MLDDEPLEDAPMHVPSSQIVSAGPGTRLGLSFNSPVRSPEYRLITPTLSNNIHVSSELGMHSPCSRLTAAASLALSSSFEVGEPSTLPPQRPVPQVTSHYSAPVLSSETGSLFNTLGISKWANTFNARSSSPSLHQHVSSALPTTIPNILFSDSILTASKLQHQSVLTGLLSDVVNQGIYLSPMPFLIP